MSAQIYKAVGVLKRRLQLMVRRGVVQLVTDALDAQGIQLALPGDSLADGVERFQNYGLTSVPHAGAEGILVRIGGDRGNSVVIAVEDRRYRLQGMKDGEVALYTDEGDKIHLQRGNQILIQGGSKVTINTKDAVVSCSGTATVSAKGGVTLDGLGSGATNGVVQGDCVCAFTGAPHPQVSQTVKASL